MNELLKYHKIDFNQDMDAMTKSEMSKVIDKIILVHAGCLSAKGNFYV